MPKNNETLSSCFLLNFIKAIISIKLKGVSLTHILTLNSKHETKPLNDKSRKSRQLCHLISDFEFKRDDKTGLATSIHKRHEIHRNSCHVMFFVISTFDDHNDHQIGKNASETNVDSVVASDRENSALSRVHKQQ